MGLLTRQMLLAALNVNALRPPTGLRSGIGAFGAGWLTTELAPHLLTATAVDALTHPPDGSAQRRAGWVLAGANAAALGLHIARSHRSRSRIETALTEALGVDYVEQLDQAPTPADLALPWRTLANPFRQARPDVVVERDIAYADAGRRTMLDVYRPAEAVHPDGAPVLLQIHGGAWVTGSKNHQAVPLMQHMASRGWVCVSINYRLAGRDPWPAQIIDVKRAIAWVREHIAEYGGSPDYLALTGGSAGGHLTALAALTPNDPAFQPGFEQADTSVDVAVPHYGVYDLAGASGLPHAVRMRDRFLGPRVLRRRFRDDPQAFEDASPLLRITPEAPDFLVVHGSGDSVVDVEQGRLFAERLREVSDSTVVYVEMEGAQHAFDNIASIRGAHLQRGIDRYLHWHWNGWRGRPVGTSPDDLAEEQQ